METINLLNDLYLETGLMISKIKKKKSKRLAYSTLFGKIVLSNDIEVFFNDEIKAVILHEYGHIKQKHHLRLLALTAAYLFALTMVAIQFPALLFLLFPLVTALLIIARVIFEKQADGFVVNYGYGHSLISFIEKAQSSRFDIIYLTKDKRIKNIKKMMK